MASSFRLPVWVNMRSPVCLRSRHKEPRMHPWPAPSVPNKKTNKDTAAFPEGRDRQGRLVPKGGAAKAEPRQRRQSRSDNTGASRTQ